MAFPFEHECIACNTLGQQYSGISCIWRLCITTHSLCESVFQLRRLSHEGNCRDIQTTKTGIFTPSTCCYLQKVLWTSSRFDFEIWCVSVSTDTGHVSVVVIFWCSFCCVCAGVNTTGATCRAGNSHSFRDTWFHLFFWRGSCWLLACCMFFACCMFWCLFFVFGLFCLFDGWMVVFVT